MGLGDVKATLNKTRSIQEYISKMAPRTELLRECFSPIDIGERPSRGSTMTKQDPQLVVPLTDS